MKYLLLLVLLTSCGTFIGSGNVNADRKFSCVSDMYKLGMRAVDTVTVCKFVEDR